MSGRRPPSFWYSQPESQWWHSSARIALTPFAHLYVWIGRRYRARQRRHAFQASVPLICIGNVNMGGVGKTPVGLAFLKALQAMGKQPHILLRGYGGSVKHARAVKPNDQSHEVGDEALLYREHAPTWVGADRIASAQQAIGAGADVLLMDDGFQNETIHKDLKLLVIDAKLGFGNRKCFPAGPLREPISDAFERANGLVVMHSGPGRRESERLALPFDGIRLHAQFQFSDQTREWLTNRKLVAFAGIGNPSKFFDSLRVAGAELLHEQAFADHAEFREADLVALEERANALGADLITTEKDFVRLGVRWKQKVASAKGGVKFDDESSLTALLEDFFSKQS